MDSLSGPNLPLQSPLSWSGWPKQAVSSQADQIAEGEIIFSSINQIFLTNCLYTSPTYQQRR